ncbi:MAG: Sjogren's syndrome/scleroderma autoantigen 1 family protein [Methanothrix sp.]
MDEDEVLSKITRLLEQGCTMLATHHDCGAPLFRRQGEVVCPVCSFADEPNSPVRALPSGLSGAELDEKSNFDRAHLLERGEIDDEELMAAIGNLRASLLHRLREITAALEDEHDLDKLKKQLDCLEGLLQVFRSLQG